MKNKMFKISLDDYSTPPFITATKEYYGTLEDIKTFIEFLKNDESRRNEYNNTIDAFNKYTQGNKKVKHTVAYEETQLLTSVKIIHEEEQNLQDKEWNHNNTWGCSYIMKLDTAKAKHYWIKDDEGYCRILKIQINGLCYKGPNNNYIVLNDNFWGFPGIIIGENNMVHNSLACIEKKFDSLNELHIDYENFIQTPDINLEKVCEDVFGDG